MVVQSVKTLLEEFFLEPFLIHRFTSVHHPNDVPDISVGE
jgi:hypothetical protein